MVDILDLNDDFGSMDSSLWPMFASHEPSTDFESSGGTLHFTGMAEENWIPTLYTWPRLHGTQWNVDFPYSGPSIRVTFIGPAMTIEILMTPGLEVSLTRSTGTHTATLGGDFHHFRVTRNRFWYGDSTGHYDDNDFFFVEASTDGTVWQRVDYLAVAEGDPDGPFEIHVELNGSVDLHDIHGITVPLTPEGTGGGDDTPEAANPYNPHTPMPAAGAGCMTVLDAIRAYSLSVRAAVRIVGPNQIEVVDPNEPFPSGWAGSDFEDLYITDEATQKGYVGRFPLVDMNLTASMQDNDDRLLDSDWRIPQRLPIEYYGAAPVVRVSHNIAPRGMTTELEFYLPPELVDPGEGE